MNELYLKELVSNGHTLAEIVRACGKSNTGTRYWLHKYGLQPAVKMKSAKIWTMTTIELQDIINNSKSFKEAFIITHSTDKFSSGAYSRFRDRLIELKIDCSKIICNKSKFNVAHKKKSLSEIMVKDSQYPRNHLKTRLIIEKILHNSCSICGQGPLWNNKPLSLQLDHINGVSNDCRKENLRLLCPNCHTQTDTHSKRTFVLKAKCYCVMCGTKINRSKRCVKCSGKMARKVLRPSKEELFKLVWETPTTKIAKQYGVSDKAVAKWCKIYGITKPQQGYWRKRLTAG